MHKTFIPVLCLVLSAQFLKAQNYYCGTDEVWSQMVRNDSSLLFQRQVIDNAISKLSNRDLRQPAGGPKSLSPANATVIPVVIYVVYDSTDIATNISMAQIQSQMDQLNQNFAAYGYSFCYAKRNVNDTSFFIPHAGDSAGVFRIASPFTNVNEYTQDAQLKALSHLPSQNYLRIYVVKNITPVNVIGYTVLPGSSSAKDGIVMRYDVFGSNNLCASCSLLQNYNLGAAMTHEAGHFLDLYHTFQGGCTISSGPYWQTCQIDGDRVCDTPPTTGNFGCPSTPQISCTGDTELVQNYMDYTNDPCKNSFTYGQKARMDFATGAYHYTLVSAENLINTGVTCVDLSSQYANIYCRNFNGCLNDTMTFVSLNSSGFIYHWNFGDGDSAQGATVQHIYTQQGQFPVSLTALNPGTNTTGHNSIPVFITSCQPIICGYNKWEFEIGYLDFSSGTPVATSHVVPSSLYPYAAARYTDFYRADSAGVPLFHIYAPENSTLSDTSFNLVDTFGSTDYCVLVPCPGPNKFCYISQPSTYQVDSLHFSIIRAGNGGVSVLPNRRNIFIPVSDPTAQFYNAQHGITGVPNCDGSKYWVIIYFEHGIFNVFELNNNDTLIFHQRYQSSHLMNAAGYEYLTVSPDGRNLLIGITTGNDGISANALGSLLLKFDKSTGTILSETFLSTAGTLAYPVDFRAQACFSPNSRFIYQQGWCCHALTGNTGYIYQYDLCNNDPVASKKTIAQFPVAATLGPSAGCNLGPDNKIYLGFLCTPDNIDRAFRLAVINNPDVLENGSNSTGYNTNGPDIKAYNSPYPGANILGVVEPVRFDVPDAYGCNWHRNPPPSFNYCVTSCTSYQFHTDDCYTHVWNFGDVASGINDSSILSDPTHTYTAAGDYPVKLIANGQTLIDTIHISGPSALIAATPVATCPVPHSSYSVTPVQAGISYNWSVINGTPAYATSTPYIDVQWNLGDTTGRVKLVAVDNITGCVDSAVMNLHFPNAGTDTFPVHASICQGEVYQLGSQQITAAGTYTHLLMSGSGCDSFVVLHLTVNQRQTPTIILSGANLLSTGSYVAYQWLLNGAPIPGATGSRDTALQNGSYTVIVTDAGGCTDTSGALKLTGLSVQNLFDNTYIQIYPNPSTGELHIEAAGIVEKQLGIRLYDVCGKLLQAKNEEGNKGKISTNLILNEYANGIYLLQISAEQLQVSRKIILAK